MIIISVARQFKGSEESDNRNGIARVKKVHLHLRFEFLSPSWICRLTRARLGVLFGWPNDICVNLMLDRSVSLQFAILEGSVLLVRGTIAKRHCRGSCWKDLVWVNRSGLCKVNVPYRTCGGWQTSWLGMIFLIWRLGLVFVSAMLFTIGLVT